MKRLPRSFYLGETLDIAKALLGRFLVTSLPEGVTVGRIVETEAYLGPKDKAAHSYKKKGPEGRVSVQYGTGGYAYVYLIYGMHCCFNVVTGPEEVPEVVLIRALEPVDWQNSLSLMASRRGVDPERLALGEGKGEDGVTSSLLRLSTPQRLAGRLVGQPVKRAPANFLCGGPGRLCQALGITRELYGEDLCGSRLYITQGEPPVPEDIAATPRIGIDYAEEARDYPWRFVLAGSPYLSQPFPEKSRGFPSNRR